MWEWTLNWNEIRDDLLIGSCPMTTADIDRIRIEGGATAVLSLQTDQCRSAFGIDYEELRAHGEQSNLAMANAPMLDFDPPDQRRNLPRAVRSLCTLLADRRRVYLHCTAGCNRSPLTALGYLTFVEQLSVDDAMAIILAARPQADPSWEAYNGCRADLVEALREFIAVRAYYLSEAGADEEADEHWLRAEREMIRESLTRPPLPARGRLDPSRDDTQAEVLVATSVLPTESEGVEA